jgi:hypothetical protein
VQVRVVYNRGRVTVYLGAGGVGAGAGSAGTGGDGGGNAALQSVLEAHVLPVSLHAPGGNAVFGFTASTGDATQTVEVDDLVVSRLDCADVQEVAEVIDVPTEPVSAGASVTLDGSASTGGPGDEDEPLEYLWSVLSGPAAVDGPSHGPTITLATTAPGTVEVELTVDDGQCANPATTVVTFAVGAAGGNWIRCDCSGDGARDVSDPVKLLVLLFFEAAAPECLAACDCSSDGLVNISDAIFDLNYQFRGGRAPALPYPGCDSFPDCADGCPAAR